MLAKLKAMSGSLASGGSVLGSGGATTGAGSPLGKQAEDIERLVRQVNAGKVGVHALGKELKNLGQGGGGNMGKLADLPEALRNKILSQHPELQKEWEDRLRQASLGTIKGLPDITGKDLAKIQALPDINDITKKDKSDQLSKFLKTSGIGKIIGGVSVGNLIADSVKSMARLLTSEIKKTFEDARQIYGKALTSGMGTQFTVKRSLLASIMGVSEQDVFRFGAQMAYLNPKLENAVSILTKTNPKLTQVSWSFKVLEADASALFATLANDAAPAILNLVGAIDKMVKAVTAHKSELEAGARIIAFGFTGGLSEVARLANKALPGGKQDNLPGPQSWMKQLPASHWERMGLVTMGGSQNYAKDTARNTKEMAIALRALAAHMIKGGKTGSWGMSPQASQP